MESILVSDVLNDPVQAVSVDVPVVAPDLSVCIARLVLLKVRVDVAILVIAKVVLGMVLAAEHIWNFGCWHSLMDGQCSWLRRPLVAKVCLCSRDIITGNVKSMLISNVVQAAGIAIFINVAVVSLDFRVGVAGFMLFKVGVGVTVLVIAKLILRMVLLADNSGRDFPDSCLC